MSSRSVISCLTMEPYVSVKISAFCVVVACSVWVHTPSKCGLSANEEGEPHYGLHGVERVEVMIQVEPGCVGFAQLSPGNRAGRGGVKLDQVCVRVSARYLK